MPSLLELDDLAYDLILSRLRYIDLYNLSITCRTLRKIVQSASIQVLNCTRSYVIPIPRLPYTSVHHLYDHTQWRNLKQTHGTRREALYLTRLFFTSRHRHQVHTLSLRHVILDGTRVNVLDIIHFIATAPHLRYISVRFCTEVHRLLLQNYLDSLAQHRNPITLERLDVIGIEGLPFFEPQNNGMLTFDEREIELIGTGPEYDYTDTWREQMYDFKMSLERVPTTHGRSILTDIDRCSQSYCRNFDIGRKELADPTTDTTLPACFLCSEAFTRPLCRKCIAARSCKICRTFICPTCYDIDTSYELANLTSHQEWLQTLAHEFTLQERNCALDMRVELGPKACLTMQQVHRHLQARATCELSLEEGFL